MAVSLGVDQGLSGGLCLLTGLTDADFRSVIPMPTRKAVGGGKRPDVQKIKAWLNPLVRQFGMPGLVVIERTQAMGNRQEGGGQAGGKQSPKHVMTQGTNAGIVIGVFEMLNWSIEEPTPQMWKKSVLAGFGEKDKSAMIAVCKQRFPTLQLRSSARATKDHDGMADAVGLALFGQYRLGNVPT